MVARGVRGRSWLAVIGVLGMVGSLLAVGTGPAGGVEGEADNEAVYSACVGVALESAGLVDVVGTFAEDAVNCLAHFGVTRGRTATMYDPGSPVLRWQMALFLSRAAGPAGIALPANPAAVFTDIGGLFESARTAVNQMAALDIMPALRGTSFGPNTAVSRAQMALMLDSFLVAAEKGSGLGLGALGADTDELADVAPDDAVFDDIANVTRGEYSAIRRMFELGVTRGTADGRFSPSGLVTRAQMAVFITRMLAHTVARPRGITLQASESSVTEGESVDLVVSVRDTSLMGVPDALVDVFSSTSADDAFGEDGRCSADDVSAVGGSGVCEISLSDEATDPSGDLEASTTNLDASTTLWAWTGDNGDRYDADDMVGSSVVIAVSKAGTKLRVTDDMPEGATAAEFGERVVFTLQVVDEDGSPVAKKDESVTVAAAETVTTAGDNGTSNTSSSTRAYKTDASGKIELSFRQTDPRSGSGNTGDSARLNLYITLASGSSLTLEDKTNLEKAGTAGTGAEDASAVWRDSTPVATTLMLSQTVSYVEASKAGNGAAHAVTATLTDQFGNPVARQKIHFTSDDPLGIGEQSEDASLAAVRATISDFRTAPGAWGNFGFGVLLDLLGEARYTRTTNRRGAATLTYTRDSDASAIETVRARLVRGADDARRQSGDEADLIAEEELAVYWVDELSDGGSASGRILVKDDENSRIVVGGADGGVTLAVYDSNDQFTGLAGPVTLADFEKDLKGDAAHLTVDGYDDTAKGVSHFTLAAEWPQVDLSGIPGPAADQRLEADSGTNVGMGHYASDNDTIVVGSWFENNYAGAVYVYDGAGDTSPTRLTAPTPQPTTFTGDAATTPWYVKPWSLNLPTSGGWFGWAVDIRGDTLVVGEPGRLSATNRQVVIPGDPQNGTAADGAVYVYTRSGGDWTLDATLTAGGSTLDGSPHPEHGFEFGRSVAVSENEKVIAVGAPRLMAGTRVGGVYLYEQPASAAAGKWDDDNGAGSPRLAPHWEELVANGNNWTWYHASRRELAISEDGSTVVAGAHFFKADVGGVKYPWAGAAYVYTEPAGGWTSALVNPDAKLESPAPLPAEKVGRSVAVSADGGTVVVSANFRPNLMRRGKVLIFERPDSTADAGQWGNSPDPTAVLRPPDRPDAPSTCTPGGPVLGCNLGEIFGQWVDITDDGNSILASRVYRTEGNQRGSIHLFTKPTDGWSSVTDEAQPASVEYLGAKPGAGLGWRNTFDQALGVVYAFAVDPDVEGPTSTAGATGNGKLLYRITPAS